MKKNFTMNDKHPLFTHQRQVHLDFHTSPFIPDVGVEFDARAFAETFKRAHVNSVNVFAKCHHGMCYYPTKTGKSHPAIGNRDLLGEQIEALHKAGIRAPIYTTIVWEENVAQTHPEWRQMDVKGDFAQDTIGPDGLPGHIGMWKFNDFSNSDYQDYFEAHVRELLNRYGKDVDGFWFDILFLHPKGGWSHANRKLRAKHGLLDDTLENFARLQGIAQKAFSEKFTRIVHGMNPDVTLFYNAQNDGNMHPQVGPRMRQEQMTHFEIESLPSGFWGYFHFPRMARMQSHWDKPWLGMTGRFQKMWGDFGGIKPQPALEFECFRSQALGGANSIGDQLPPRGTLDPAAYELIGAVYKQCEEAEPFYEGASFVRPRIGIFSASYAGFDGGTSEEGAVLLCEEAHYDCALLDGEDELNDYNLLILPDSTVVTPQLAEKLKTFHKNGGKLLISGKGGFDAGGNWALPFLPLEFNGEVDLYPTFWRAKKSFDSAMSSSDRVFYQPGMNVIKNEDIQVLIDRILPYFKRSAITFSSHFQTPPQANADAHPAAVSGDGFVYFADPIFREYRQSGNIAVRDAWRKVMQNQIGPSPFGDGLSSHIIVYPLRKDTSLLLTLLHYVPIRKARDIDIIDERGTFCGERLRIAGNPKEVRIYNSGEILRPAPDGSFELPPTAGRLLLEVPEYF